MNKTLWIALGLVLSCWGCSEDPAEGLVDALTLGLATVPDTTPPSVVIASPTTASTYATDVSPLPVAGTASDDREIRSVRVSGGGQVFFGSARSVSWSAEVPLLPGTQAITVTAYDASGNVGTAVLNVTYTRPVVILSSPTTASTFTAAVPSVTLRGEAMDDALLSGVDWLNEGSGQTGVAGYNGTTFVWVATIPLIEGTNRITVSASDAEGHVSSISIDVSYSSAYGLAAWGDNAYGQLGNGTLQDVDTPGAVPGLAGVVAADGSRHTVVLRNDGTVWTWGRNDYGQLGDGATADRAAPAVVPALPGATAVVAGSAFTVALLSDGSLMAWGGGGTGQLGRGSRVDSSTPVSVSGISGVVAVSAGDAHVLALRSDGTVWAWGDNSQGQLGDGSTRDALAPTQVPGLSGVVAVAAGGYHSLALLSDGTVRAWGINLHGQIGNGTSGPDVLAPVSVQGLSNVVAIAGGGYHSLALLSDGSVRAWGSGGSGQLGDGTSTSKDAPVAVSGLTAVVGLASGTSHSVALAGDGTVWTWGSGLEGQLGNGTRGSYSLTPLAVQGLPAATFIGAGSNHALAGW